MSTWLVLEFASLFVSTSLSSGMGPWPEVCLETGLLPLLTGRPKNELRGETMPGDVAPGVVAVEERYMLLTMFAAPGTSDVERR